MVFEPISGTIGAVALLDPMFRGVSWIYGKYKLGKAFGAHYQSYSIKYASEVARFARIRNQKIALLASSPMDEQDVYLTDAIRNRLVACLKDFEDCEELMRNHDPDVVSESEETTDSGDQTENSPVRISGLPITPAQSRGSSIPDTPQPTTPRTSRESDHPSVATSKSSKFKQIFSRKGKEKAASRDTLTVTSALVLKESAATLGVPNQIPRLQQQMKSRQEQTGVATKLVWVVKDRERFLKLLVDLKDHNDYFESMILLQTSHQRRNSYASATDATPLRITRDVLAGSHLQRLISGLSAVTDSKKIVFELMLHSDPFEFHDRLSKYSKATTGLRPSSGLFAMQLLNFPANNAQKVLPKNVPVFVEVPLESRRRASRSSPLLSSSIRHLNDLQTSIKQTSDTHSDDSFCHPVGSLTTSEPANDKSITIYYDSTPYTFSKTLRAALSSAEEAELRDNMHLRFRGALASVIAATFLHCLNAGYPMEFSAEDLLYYKDVGDSVTALTKENLASSRIKPYVRLQVIGATPKVPSSRDLLSSAIDAKNSTQVMINKLGVLLYEVGAWKGVDADAEAGDWKARAAAARLKKVDLLKMNSVAYFNVVHACLEWVPDDVVAGADVGDWLASRVVAPLRKTMESLPRVFV